MNYFGPLLTLIQWHRKDAASGRWFCWACRPSRPPWPCCWPWLAARPSVSAAACSHWTSLFLPCNPGRHQSTRPEPSPPAQSFSSAGHTPFSLNALFEFVFALSDRVSHWTPGNTPASASQVMGFAGTYSHAGYISVNLSTKFFEEWLTPARWLPGV